MKIVPSIIALCAHLVLSSIVGIEFGCEAVDIFSDYLKRPKMPQFSRYHRDIRKWLQTIELDPQAEPESVLAELGRQLEKASGASRKNYETLVKLADDSIECRVELVDFVVSVYAQLDQARLKSLGNFLDHFASKKFNRCAAELNTAIERQPRAEQEIDKFFEVRLQLAPHSSDAELLDAIQSANRKFQLAFEQCSDLRSRFGNILNIFNLARSFGFQERLEARLLKLNEYSRFCTSQLILGDY